MAPLAAASALLSVARRRAPLAARAAAARSARFAAASALRGGAALPGAGGGTAPSRPAAAAGAKRAPLAARRVLCVASCKGGVGKSSVAANLAAGLARRGQRVGILDMDVYGPSLPSLLPMQPGLQVHGDKDGRIVPVRWRSPALPHELQLMSYGYLRPGEFAAIRGPIVSGIAQQLLTGVAWDSLDTLVIDMPPGTGDVHLTVAQQIPVDAAVMVTTPQQLALVDVEKGIKMFDKVGIPTVMLVENMSYFDCGGCSAKHFIFGEGGGKRLAQTFGIESFHQLPIDPVFNSASRESSDGPALARAGHSGQAIVQAMHGLVAQLDEELDRLAASRGSRPKAEASMGGAILTVTGGGKPPESLRARPLRLACSCAHCVDEWTGEPRLDPAKVPEDVAVVKVESAGRYAVVVHWSDMHQSIYPFTRLWSLADTVGVPLERPMAAPQSAVHAHM